LHALRKILKFNTITIFTCQIMTFIIIYSKNVQLKFVLPPFCCLWFCKYDPVIVQEQDRLGEIPAAFLLLNVLHLHQQRWLIHCVYGLALRKIINENNAVLSQKIKKRTFLVDYRTRKFWVLFGVSRYAATSLVVALSPG
jgi:hypothetical protein